MKIIKKLSYKSAYYLQKSCNKTNESKRILYFGFQAIYGDLIKFAIIIFVSLLLQSFLPVLTIALTFAFLRRYAGGFHMDTEVKCIIGSLCLFVIPGTIISKIQFEINIFIFIAINTIVLTICLFLLLKYSPKDCINRPIDDSEAIIFKRKSIRDFIVLILISIILVFLGRTNLSLSIIIGIILEIFTIVPIGYRFFELISSLKVFTKHVRYFSSK